jgi:hypothetical protein
MSKDKRIETDEEHKIVELKQSPTTIWLKKGTKNLLDSLGQRKDTYDDIIRALVRENQRLKKQLDSLEPAPKNRLKISSQNIKKGRLQIEKGHYIEYVYNLPKLPFDDGFAFDVNYTKVVCNFIEVPKYEKYSNAYEMAKDYLKIIEQIIKQNMDPLFKIELKMMLDLEWWKRMFKNLGLPENSFNEDIRQGLIKLGFAP